MKKEFTTEEKKMLRTILVSCQRENIRRKNEIKDTSFDYEYSISVLIEENNRINKILKKI